LSYAEPTTKQRSVELAARRNRKMARSAHAYMRGNTVKFYEWLDTAAGHALPDGPAVWICGDCHVGNLGPIANLQGRVDIQIRDLDQTVVGNPAHDLIRLGLSLATAARSSDLPGVVTARMMGEMVLGYTSALADTSRRRMRPDREAKALRNTMAEALRRRWKHLAKERIEDTSPNIPRDRRFWELTRAERQDLAALLETPELRKLVTGLRNREVDSEIDLLDAAYWVKGCSSLGRLRYAALVGVSGAASKDSQICFLDIKEGVTAAAPRFADAEMPRDNAERVVQGARHLSPNLGERMLAARMQDRSVVIRELLPQDLKLELDQLSQTEAVRVAGFLATVVGEAHGRQMRRGDRLRWRKELLARHSKTLDAPSWLWTSVVDLVGIHESAYLEHCRRFPLAA
jgi:uncharacterized protein (DUF2252 family)